MYRNSFWTLTSITTLVLSLACGCTSDKLYEYRAHTDKVTAGAGNASAANRAVHTVDPWPSYSQKTQIEMDGKRALLAVRRYETNTTIKPKGLSSDPVGNGGTDTNNGATKN
jgi:hypothetical protein